MRKNLTWPFFGAGPAECAVAGERLDRGQKSKKVRILEKVIGKEFFKSSFVNSWILIQHARPFPTVRAADRFAHTVGPFHFDISVDLIWEIVVALFAWCYFRNCSLSFSWRDFRKCSLLVFVVQLSKSQFAHVRGATF